MTQDDKNALAEALANKFNQTERRVLLKELGVSPEDVTLRAETARDEAWHIVSYFERRGSLERLRARIEQERPKHGQAVSNVGAPQEAVAGVIAVGENPADAEDGSAAITAIQNPILRALLLVAAQCQDPGQAIAWAAHAYRKLRGMVEEVVGAANGLEMWIFATPRYAEQQLTCLLDNNRHHTVVTQLRSLADVEMRLVPDDERRLYRLVAGRGAAFSQGAWNVQEIRERVRVPSPTVADAEWLVGLVAREVMRLERENLQIVSMISESIDRNNSLTRVLPWTVSSLGEP